MLLVGVTPNGSLWHRQSNYTVENDNGVNIKMFTLNFMKIVWIIYAFSSFQPLWKLKKRGVLIIVVNSLPCIIHENMWRLRWDCFQINLGYCMFNDILLSQLFSELSLKNNVHSLLLQWGLEADRLDNLHYF